MTSVMVSVRRLLARARWLYWVAVAVCAAGTGLAVQRQSAGVAAAAEAWGDPVAVLVADHDIEVGDALAGSVTVRSQPAPMVPAAAVVGELPPAEVIARQRIAAGEVVVDHDLAPGRAPQSLIPPGWVAVPIVEPAPSGATVGTDVQIASGATIVSSEGVVVAADAGGAAVLVAVPESRAAAVAEAAAAQTALVLVTGDQA